MADLECTDISPEDASTERPSHQSKLLQDEQHTTDS